jgi:membrane protein
MVDKAPVASESFKWKSLPNLLWNSAVEWNKDDVWQLSASVAYYAILALPGLLVIIINVVGAVWDTEIATGRLTTQLASLIGYDAAGDLTKMMQAARADEDSWIANLIGIGTLIFGATGVFYQLQLAINKIWKLKVNPKTPWWKILTDRAKSFGFILVIGFLSLISFILSAGISYFQDWIDDNFSNYLGSIALGINFLLSLSIISVLFALMFRFLPDARVQWKTVWPGAIITGIFFELGKFILGIYFGNYSPASAYGAAGLIVLILLWVSYSCLILFFGAEFIKVYAARYKDGIHPNSKALKFKEEFIMLESGEELSEKDVQDISDSDAQ